MVVRRVLLIAASLGLILSSPARAEEEKQKTLRPYMELDAVTATVFLPGGRRGVLMVQAGLQIPNPALRAAAETRGPYLRDAYVGALQGYAARLSPGSLPDADYVARLLQMQTDRVLGRPGAQVLLGGLMVN